MIRLLTAPSRFALRVALDVLFGPEEPFDYTGSTSPDVCPTCGRANA